MNVPSLLQLRGAEMLFVFKNPFTNKARQRDFTNLILQLFTKSFYLRQDIRFHANLYCTVILIRFHANVKCFIRFNANLSVYIPCFW